MRPVRVSAKALIVRGGRILLVRCVDREGPWWLLPGGGQDPGEPLPAALRRECREEVGAEVEVGPLLFVRDYIGKNHEFADEDPEAHQVELMFACALAPGAAPRVGLVPDRNQAGIDWVALARLPEVRFFPRALGRILADQADLAEGTDLLAGADLRRAGPVYLGDVN